MYGRGRRGHKGVLGSSERHGGDTPLRVLGVRVADMRTREGAPNKSTGARAGWGTQVTALAAPATPLSLLGWRMPRMRRRRRRRAADGGRPAVARRSLEREPPAAVDWRGLPTITAKLCTAAAPVRVGHAPLLCPDILAPILAGRRDGDRALVGELDARHRGPRSHAVILIIR